MNKQELIASIESVQIKFCSKYHCCVDCPASIEDISYCGFEKIKDNVIPERVGKNK